MNLDAPNWYAKSMKYLAQLRPGEWFESDDQRIWHLVDAPRDILIASPEFQQKLKAQLEAVLRSAIRATNQEMGPITEAEIDKFTKDVDKTWPSTEDEN